MKKNVKLIATIVATVMLVMILASISASAAQWDKYYRPIAINGNAKFWIDPTVPQELLKTHYNYETDEGKKISWTVGNYINDFVAGGGGCNQSVLAAKYPLEIDYSTTDKYADNAWVMSDNTLRTPSGVVYQLPRKTETATEKEVISLGSNTTWESNVSFGRKTKKVHFLVAGALAKDMVFTVQPKYVDSENYVEEAKQFTIKGNALEPGNVNKVCRLKSLETEDAGKNKFINGAGYWGGELVLQEYTIEMAYPDAVLDKVRFVGYQTVADNGARIGTFSIIAITAEDAEGENPSVPAASAPALADGSYSVIASTPVAGKAVLAIYDKADNNKLVAVKFTDIEVGNQTQKITVESENIVAGKEYAAKVMVLDGTDTLIPLTGALTIG